MKYIFGNNSFSHFFIPWFHFLVTVISLFLIYVTQWQYMCLYKLMFWNILAELMYITN
jgi:hypothetical protein